MVNAELAVTHPAPAVAWPPPHGGGCVGSVAAGTLIRTARGEMPVETLRPGDVVVAVCRGGFAPVRRLGRRDIAVRGHPQPWDINPVRLRAHAFGPDRPCRDLRLSPDHAVYVDGALFLARDLLNGSTIAQQDVSAITYFQVELDRHDVLVADGMPAESFLDTDTMTASGIMNAGARAREAASCAPLVWRGAKLAATRQALAAQAERLNWWIATGSLGSLSPVGPAWHTPTSWTVDRYLPA